MKKTITLLVFCGLTIASIAQTNESDASLYSWKGKKTQPSNGYIILKSGKQVNGMLTLIGKPNALTQIIIVENGKELKLPTSAVKAYGLGSERSKVTNGVKTGGLSGPQCDHNPELFVWRNMGEQMGKVIENTKPRNGYVITRNGSKTEGELQLKRVDGRLAEFKLKASSGKMKLTPAEVANYGLMMTISELTKNGDKVYKDEARNFHGGSVTLKNGNKLNGQIAFRKKDYINPNKPGMGFKYDGIFFAEKIDDYLKTYSNSELAYVTQSINGRDLNYSPYEGGFVAEDAMDNVKFRDNLRELNPGVLTLKDGTKLNGMMAKFDKKSMNYKNESGIIKKYNAYDIQRFDVTVEGENRSVINLGGELTEEIYKGNVFWAYINPNPTTVNTKKTEFARSAAGFGTAAIGAAVMNNDAKKNGYNAKLDSLVLYSSLEELIAYRQTFWKLSGVNSSEEYQDKVENESARKFEASLSLAIAGKEAQKDIVVYYEEIILINQKTNEKYKLYKNKKMMNKELEGLLNGCYTFLTMDKKDQKPYYNVDNIKQTLSMLSECY